MEQQGGQYEVYLQDGQVISTSLQPSLATGFHSGAKQMEAFFEWKGNGKPQLSEEADESTLVNNLFVRGQASNTTPLFFALFINLGQGLL
ncbi:hypothetical protein CHH54_03695 [Bacillus sp. 7520-S]|nr:hypothetical protein CHH54_03695 [Bacillus sp. 7520-S]